MKIVDNEDVIFYFVINQEKERKTSNMTMERQIYENKKETERSLDKTEHLI